MKLINYRKLDHRLAVIALLSTFSIGCATQVSEPPLSHTSLKVDKAETIKIEPKIIPVTVEPPTNEATVYFQFDSSVLSSQAKNTIETHIRFLQKNPDFTITLEGHTDSRGDDQYNSILGSSRVEAIKQLLVAENINENKIELISYGEKQPAIKGDTEQAWRSNRRAKLVYNKIEG